MVAIKFKFLNYDFEDRDSWGITNSKSQITNFQKQINFKFQITNSKQTEGGSIDSPSKTTCCIPAAY
jgi:hypothetical protein